MTPAHAPATQPSIVAGITIDDWPFSIGAVFPAFALIGARFAVDGAALQQLISVYLITFAGMSPFQGVISDRERAQAGDSGGNRGTALSGIDCR